MRSTASTSSIELFWLPSCATCTVHRPAPSNGGAPVEHLLLEPSARVEPPFVEHLGREVADGRRQAPGLRQKDSAVGRNGLVALKNVVERRHVGALRMRALLRLLELLRIAEQDDAPRGLRNGQHVGERHLPRLVDEEHVDGAVILLARPLPRGARPDVRPAGA